MVQMSDINASEFTFVDMHPGRLDVREEVVKGFSATPKYLPPKLFYDDTGSSLFQKITELPEYYLTRSEIEILNSNSTLICDMISPGSSLVEFGSGDLSKISILLQVCQKIGAYVPIDISKELLLQASRELSISNPGLRVHAVCSDYNALSAEMIPFDGAKTFVFLGSTIGNFEPDQATSFLARVRGLMRDGDQILIGCDRVKDKHKLEMAYNDSQGITAEFNLNMITRISRDLGLALQIQDFEHLAFYNSERNRIEMHLRSKREQDLTIDGHSFHISEGELIHTENSYKFSRESFGELVSRAGLEIKDSWTDHEENFWLFCLMPG